MKKVTNQEPAFLGFMAEPLIHGYNIHPIIHGHEDVVFTALDIDRVE